jgi:hypothetical protein
MPHALFAQRWMWTVLMAMLFTAPAMAEVRIGVVGTHNTSSMSDAGPDALL